MQVGFQFRVSIGYVSTKFQEGTAPGRLKQKIKIKKTDVTK